MHLKIFPFSTGMGILLLLLCTFFFSPKTLAENLSSKSVPTGEEPGKTDNEIVSHGGILTLQKAIALALEYNPDLKASYWEQRSMEGRVIQAGLLPNPEISAEMENFGGTGDLKGVDGAETTVQLSQLIELGGKRPKRKALASLDRDLAGWDYRVRRADLIAEVKASFAEVLLAQEHRDLMRESRGLAAEVFNATAERVKAGKVSPVEETKARVALSSSQIDLNRAEYGLKVARRKLSETWGGKMPGFEKVQGEIGPLFPLPPLDVLEGLIPQNPEMARRLTAVDQRRADLRLEEARKIPDLTVSLGARQFNETDDTALVLGISVPLPIFDRNQGGIAEALGKLSKAKEESRAVETKVFNALGERYQVLSSAFTEANSLEKDVLPQARAAFDASREGYLQGKFDYLDMLDAQRTLIEVKERHINAMASYRRALSEVERLIGMDMQEAIRAHEKGTLRRDSHED